MAQEIVRIQFSEGGGRKKLRFKHKDLRDAQQVSGKSVAELLGDKFGGWPYLLMFAQRSFDRTMTVDKASDQIDEWVDQPDPETKKDRTLDELGLKLLDAIYASKFIVPDKEKDEEAPEGNATPEAES